MNIVFTTTVALIYSLFCFFGLNKECCGCVHSCSGVFGWLHIWHNIKLSHSIVGSLHPWVIPQLGHSILGSFHSWVTPALDHSTVGSLHAWIIPQLGHSMLGSFHDQVNLWLGHSMLGSFHSWVTPSLDHSTVGSLHDQANYGWVTPSLDHSTVGSLHDQVNLWLGHSILGSFHSWVTPVSVSVSAQDGIVALGKAHTRSAPSLSSLPKVALETVPIFVWLNTDRSRPWRVECRPLPFSTPLSFRRSML